MMSLIILSLLALFSRGALSQVCGPEIQSISVDPFPTDDLSSIDGEWFLLGFHDSGNEIYNDIQCLHYHYYPNEDGVINITKHERYCNKTRVQTEQSINITSGNNIFYNTDITDPNANICNFRIINFNVTDSDVNNHFLIYYSCSSDSDGSKRSIFMLLTREFAQGPNMNVLEQEIRSLREVREFENRQGYLKVFGDVCGCKKEDPIWTTTTTEAE